MQFAHSVQSFLPQLKQASVPHEVVGHSDAAAMECAAKPCDAFGLAERLVVVCRQGFQRFGTFIFFFQKASHLFFCIGPTALGRCLFGYGLFGPTAAAKKR